jgi:hypothetical protein
MHSSSLGNFVAAVLSFVQVCFALLTFVLFVLIFRMDYGLWTDNSRGTYNKWDGVARSTIQVLKFMSFLVMVVYLYGLQKPKELYYIYFSVIEYS